METGLSFDLLFSLATNAAWAGWLLLALLPYRIDAPRLTVVLIALAVSIVYAALLAAFWSSGSGGFGSLDQVARLFEHRGLLLAGWVHYLAFDLLVGLWEREQARRLGMSRWLLVPCLILTLMFGPLGWLAFMALRFYLLRSRAGAAPLPLPVP
jgi:hypothetical protein